MTAIYVSNLGAAEQAKIFLKVCSGQMKSVKSRQKT